MTDEDVCISKELSQAGITPTFLSFCQCGVGVRLSQDGPTFVPDNDTCGALTLAWIQAFPYDLLDWMNMSYDHPTCGTMFQVLLQDLWDLLGKATDYLFWDVRPENVVVHPDAEVGNKVRMIDIDTRYVQRRQEAGKKRARIVEQ